MAASCRRFSRLAVLLSRRKPVRWHENLTGGRVHSCIGNVSGSGVQVLTAPLSISCQRWHPTTTAAAAPPRNGGSIFRRFWRWFNDEADEQQIIMDLEEREEREALLQRVQEMYFAKPSVSPGLDFYREVIETLVKYNDRVGVETLWNFMSEMNVEPDAELVALVEPFLQKARRNAWFE